MKNLVTTLAILAILITGCKKSDNSVDTNNVDYLIFGHFYGECFGEECVETFKLTGEKLFEDDIDDYSGKNLNFNELEADKFDLVKDLFNYFPNELKNESAEIFGCPDCADGGGIFIEYSENGIVNSWRIDQNKNEIPEYLHDFIDEVNEKILLINKD